jgi:hypothetical protein
MTEVDSMEFFERVTQSEQRIEEYTLEHQSGAEMTVELTVVNRKPLLDEINRLPDEMLDAFSQADDEDEAQELAEEQNMLTNVNGDTILAFENICVESMQDPEQQLTRHNFEEIVAALDFETLFEIGAKVIEMSFEDSGSIQNFQKVDSDKN